ncbi:uncharacterized protein LOC125940281 [Dermacentor silvarum]|uniref:uncharacterized protein LOC125940281 n=1 Tax=Dermacentor silvarum TaxID=543639 RepID=UPI0021014D74|nr:uncharacterized protein LOC125940281 [Dermacentor silvarum]
MAITLALVIVTVLAAVGCSAVDPTLKFFQDSQYTPILTYECYRTGVTIEPEGTVNFTILWDGTLPSNDGGEATTWYAINGTEDQYTTGTFSYEYDSASSTIKITNPDIEEHLHQLREAYNGLAYYWKLTITSDNDRVVYKVYDVDSRCGNAAALLRNMDRKTRQGFIFSRDVREPRRTCRKQSLCAW